MGRIFGTDGARGVANITLQYYNVPLKYLYQVDEEIPFEVNGRIGSTDSPFIPTFSIL